MGITFIVMGKRLLQALVDKTNEAIGSLTQSPERIKPERGSQ